MDDPGSCVDASESSCFKITSDLFLCNGTKAESVCRAALSTPVSPPRGDTKGGNIHCRS